MTKLLRILIISLFGFSTLNAMAANQQAAVAMPDNYSADVAQAIIEQGGNAVDAAVAASFVLAVTYPEAGNLGGGGFMTLHFAGDNFFLDYRETAPALAHRDMYLDDQGDVIPFKSLLGYRASGVPGSVMGMWQAHQRFGELDWAKLLQPAIRLAEQGFVVHPKLAQTADWYQAWSSEKNPNLNFKAYFGSLESGKVFKQPELAQTLKRLAEYGAKDFYNGHIAKQIVQQMQQGGGLINLDDLANYQVKWRKPTLADWQEYQIVSAPPPSSGGIALTQLLLMKSQLEAEFAELEHNSPQYIHLLAEMMKPVYADRAEYLGDPDFVSVPIQDLMDLDYIQKRARQVNIERISPTPHIKPGLVESEQTTHFSIIDTQGNAISNTTTLNMPFGSGVVIEGAGFLMNDEMDDFSAKPGVPNVFGVVGNQANAIEPGKRMLSSMTPTLLLKDQAVFAVVGTPGGSTIITSVFQTLVNLVDHKMSAQQAVDSNRIHHQLWPEDEIGYHPQLAPNVIKALQEMGYRVKQRGFFGDVQLIVRHPSGRTEAAADQRGRGEARVWSP